VGVRDRLPGLTLAADLRSARAVHYLTELGGRLAPYGTVPVVRDFLTELSAVVRKTAG